MAWPTIRSPSLSWRRAARSSSRQPWTRACIRIPRPRPTLLCCAPAASASWSRKRVTWPVAGRGDFKVAAQAGQKIKRGEHAVELRLVPNPDLLAVTASLPSDVRPIRVGFAAETQDLVEHAAEKLARKSLDLIVANDVSAGVFGADTNQVTLLWSDGRREDLPRMPKTDVAERVLDAVAALLAQVSA